ncbi:MAG TPA: helix-turn-helix domain-containing protein [Azonexus sp.]|nr:helix-turn-helix domain-containing protein [Azonexus sp.]
MVISKTQQALALVRTGKSVKEAAQEVGIADATVYIAINRTKGKEVCPCCGQVVREGFEINRDVLKDGEE